MESIILRPFSQKTASDREYEQLNAFLDVIRAEQLPDDPPVPHAERIQNWKSQPDFIEPSIHLAWNTAETAVIGYGEGSVWHTGDNEHICLLTLYVHPEHRCRGIGRQMLARAVDFACQQNRRLLITLSYSNIPAGEKFLERLGARRGLVTRTSQLKKEDLPLALMERWARSGDMLAGQFELGVWEGPLPEEHLEAMVEMLQQVRNDTPRDQMEVEDEKLTPEIFRQEERNMLARGDTRWMMYLRDRSNGQFAGMTEVIWNESRPQIVQQGLTAVFEVYRGHGLGRWLKGAMALKLLREHPETQILRTSNAASNMPMLKINLEMGFQPYFSRTVWQVERERLEAYLSESGGLMA